MGAPAGDGAGRRRSTLELAEEAVGRAPAVVDEQGRPLSSLALGEAARTAREGFGWLGTRTRLDRTLVVLVVVALAGSVASLWWSWLAFRSPFLVSTGRTVAVDTGWAGGPGAIHRVLAPVLLLAVVTGLVVGWRAGRNQVSCAVRVAAALAALGSAASFGAVLAAGEGRPEGRIAGTGLATGWWVAAASTLVATVAATALVARWESDGATRGRGLRSAAVVGVALVVAGGAGVVARWSGVAGDGQPTRADRVAVVGGSGLDATWVEDDGDVFTTVDDERETCCDGYLVAEVVGDRLVPVARGLERYGPKDGLLDVRGDRVLHATWEGVFVTSLAGPDPAADPVQVWEAEGRNRFEAVVLADGSTWVLDPSADDAEGVVRHLPADLGTVPVGEDGALADRVAAPVRLPGDVVELVDGPGDVAYAQARSGLWALDADGTATAVVHDEGGATPCAGPAVGRAPAEGGSGIGSAAVDPGGNVWLTRAEPGEPDRHEGYVLTADGALHAVPDLDVDLLRVRDGELLVPSPLAEGERWQVQLADAPAEAARLASSQPAITCG